MEFTNFDSTVTDHCTGDTGYIISDYLEKKELTDTEKDCIMKDFPSPRLFEGLGRSGAFFLLNGQCFLCFAPVLGFPPFCIKYTDAAETLSTPILSFAARMTPSYWVLLTCRIL